MSGDSNPKSSMFNLLLVVNHLCKPSPPQFTPRVCNRGLLAANEGNGYYGLICFKSCEISYFAQGLDNTFYLPDN